jgi:biotin carboxylase
VRSLAAAAAERGVGGVVTGWEFLSPAVARIAAELGLPGHDPALADACRNKRLMADLFARGGVPAPATLAVTGYAEAVAALPGSGIGYPLVVKPAENAGSVGVSVVRGPGELEAAVAHAQGWPEEFPHGIPLDPHVVIQEYVGGEEYSVESVVTRGRAHHLTVTRKFTTQDSRRAELGHTVPAELDPAVRHRVLAAVTAALGRLGLRDGIAHTELKVTEAGEVRIIETGARPPGDHIMKLVKLALGVDEARAYLQVALGDRPDLAPDRDRAAAIRFVTPPRDGVLRAVHGLPAGEPDIHCAVYAGPGTPCTAVQDNVGRLGHVIVVAGSAAEADKLADEILAGVTVELA